MIRGILSDEIAENEERLRPFIDSFSGRVRGGELMQSLEEGRRQCWVCGDWQAVCLTSVESDWVNIEFCSGRDRHEWENALEVVLMAWAKSMGKHAIYAMVRPGWAKLAKRNGWTEVHREFRKEVA